MAVILRPIPGSDLRDAITPYGYGGPPSLNPDRAGDYWTAYCAWCRDNGIVSSFIRFHPLIANQLTCASAEVVSETVAWPTSRHRELLGAMHVKHRNRANRALAGGIVVTVARAPRSLSEFAELYAQTMARLGADATYRFTAAYWERLQRLGDRLLLFTAASKGRIVGAALCLAGDRWLHYHLSARSDGPAEMPGVGQFLLLEIGRWAQRAGLEAVHLGGGVGGKPDSLLRFKRRFAPSEPRPAFAVGRLVHDNISYARLCLGSRSAPRFPAYRSLRLDAA
jgi:hypothetical protein